MGWGGVWTGLSPPLGPRRQDRRRRAAARLALGGLGPSWNIARNIESAEPLEDLSTGFGLPYFCSTELDPVLVLGTQSY